MDCFYSRECLLRAIKSRYEIIALWGTYHILNLDDTEINEYLGLFLESPFSNIQDAGISKIAEIGDQQYITQLLKIFRESEGQIKHSAAVALSRFPNDFSKSLIQRWFDQLIASDQSTRMEFEAATVAYLQVDRVGNFPLVQQALELSQTDPTKSAVLFANLLLFCETESEFDIILNQYFILRDLHSDAELTYQLIKLFGNLEIKEWFAESLSKGYSISSIYEQCHILLNSQNNIANRQFWLEIDKAFGDYKLIRPGVPIDFLALISNLSKWVEKLAAESGADAKLLRFKFVIKAFKQNQISFPKTIPKIIEMESQFLLSIPIQIILEQSLGIWLKKPAENLENIANYYHSSLLTREYREEILWMFFPTVPNWQKKQLEISRPYSNLSDEVARSEVLWSFYREELLGYDIPWPSIFPNPDYSFNLTAGLASIYFYNFDYYINKKDAIAIDYALQLFRYRPQKEIISLLITNFEYLIHYHTESLFQTIEYLPDPAFVDLLLNKYQPEEYEIAKLVFIICEIFNLENPECLSDDIKKIKNSDFQNCGIKNSIRLHCDECHNIFQYAVDVIYIDESSIIKTNGLTSDSVWIPQKIFCKKCASPVPFLLDDSQLREFSLQSRVDRLLRLTPQTRKNQFEQKIVLIDFPRHDSVIYSPSAFEDLVRDCEMNKEVDKAEMQTLWMKQAQLYKAMGNWKSCKKVLSKIELSNSRKAELTFLLGLVNFKLSDFAESRKHFTWIVKNNPDTIASSNISYVEQSKYFLNKMDSESAKRARFKVITGKK